MADGTQKVTASGASRFLLAVLATKLDQSDDYKLLRHIVGGDGLSRDDVLARVLGLACLRDTILQDADADPALRKLAESCGELSAELDDDDEPMADGPTNEWAVYEEHSAALQQVFDILCGVPEAERRVGPYPIDVAVAPVLERLGVVMQGFNATTDYAGELRSLVPQLPSGWERTETTWRNRNYALWKKSGTEVTVEIELGPSGPKADDIGVHPHVSFDDLVAILWTERRRAVVS